MKIRLHGTEEECREVAGRLAGIVEVLAVSAPYPDRGASVLVRVYVEAQIAPPGARYQHTEPRPRPAPGPPARRYPVNGPARPSGTAELWKSCR